MKFENKPYRDIVNLLIEFSDYFKFKRLVPHYTTLQKFLRRISLVILNFILEKTYLLFNAENANVAIDATGFGLLSASYYYEQMVHREIQKRRYMKHSIIIDTDRQVIMASTCIRNKSNEINEFKPLIKRASKLTKIKIITADKGYDSEEVHKFSREKVGAFSIIPIRHPALLPENTNGRYRRALAFNFPEKLYHQRSKVETVNFVQKQKFGNKLRSKLLFMQRKEMKLIDIVYNLYKYVNKSVKILKDFYTTDIDELELGCYFFTGFILFSFWFIFLLSTMPLV